MDGERTASAGGDTEDDPVGAAATPEPPRFAAGALDTTVENRTVPGRLVHASGAQPLPTVDASCYELAGEHARGGLGRILRARDRRLGRPVAVKELLRDSDEASARFVREAEITARLQHPGVVPIYEAGCWPNGKPFYAMRMVAGRPLSEVIAACRDVGERMALLPNVIAIAETMAYAHGQRVLHRDLKPSNVLVGDYGETVVIDWGLAKDLDQPAGGADLLLRSARGGDGGLTVVGTILGTPAYMPPEQARGEAVDARADVYALGAILYHLLGGGPPYRGIIGDGGDGAAIIAAVAAGPPQALSLATPGLPPDLLAIVDKAMARDATARYPSAAEFAADLKRFTTGQLVGAHRYTPGTLVRRWLARHRAIVAVAAAASLAIAIGGALSVANIIAARDEARAQERVATAQQRLASARADELAAQRNQLILQQAASALDRDPTEALTWLACYPADGADWSQVRSIAADAVSRGVARHVLDGLDEVTSLAISADGARVVAAGGGTVQVWDAGRGESVGRYREHEARRVAISSDGQTVASAAALQSLWIWSAGATLPRLLEGHTGRIQTIELDRDDRKILTSSKDGTLRWWDVATGTSTPLVGHRGAVLAAALLPGRGRAASIGVDGEVRVWNLADASSQVLAAAKGQGEALAVSADGSRIAAAIGGAIWVWSTPGPGRRLGQHDGPVSALRFLGDAVVSGSADKTVRVWPLSGAAPITLLGHDQAVKALAVSSAGWIASGDLAGQLRLWRPFEGGGATRTPVASVEYEATKLAGHRRAINAIEFSADGRRLATASADQTVRIWELEGPSARVLRGSRDRLFHIAYLPDQRIVTTSTEGAVRLWDLARGTSTILGAHPASSAAVVAAADGRAVATGGLDGSVLWWELGAAAGGLRVGEGRSLRRVGGRVWSLRLTPDAAWLAVVSDGGASLIATRDGATTPLLGCDGPVYEAAFSPDGERLATAGNDATVRLWRVPGGAPLAVLRGHTDIPTAPTFTRDGRRLVTGGVDGAIRIWDLASGASRVLRAEGSPVLTLALSPDGAQIASGEQDGTIALWDLETGKPTRLGAHEADVHSLAFSPDGRLLVSGSLDATARIWDLASRSSLPLRGYAGPVHDAQFSPDGTELASVSADGTLRIWPSSVAAQVPTEPAALRGWLAAQTATRGRGGDRPPP